ncbi:MauE/DoxX family redox-associated membrane protein [Flavobacterium sp.]|uniref:MauE/DoxX family redox-associated membrane protein n=1 Tax=Flavobacterium sp. TaxID=239 RepID=UPI00391A0C96
MKTTTTFKTNFIYAVALLHIILFTYAAVSKLTDFQNFQVQLGQSPLLTIFANILAYFIPALEIVISIILMVPKYRITAIYASCFLMFLFTIYIVMILNFTSYIPCSCGGVLEKLGWTEHLIFNSAFVLLSLIAILLHGGLKHTIIISIIGGSIGIASMWLLFLLSEDVMQKENPFIRRIPQGTAAKVAQADLRNTTMYIAGATLEKVYITDRKAPLQVFVWDTQLKNQQHHTIQLDQENFNFKAVQMKVVYPHFYLYDGTVPVLYRGKVSDWKAKLISHNQYGFSDILFINDSQFIIKSQSAKNYENILATIDHGNSLSVNINTSILEKQIDGIFDSDGTIQYSYELNKFVYTYYYRNEFIVTDNNLNLEYRANTIDTTTKAKLKIEKIKSTGETKMAAPPIIVNQLTAITNNLLLVNSNLRGRFESKSTWSNATVVDVYDLTNHSYLFSFYVYDEEGFRMKNCYATADALYIISGHYLLKYGFGPRIKSKLTK